jgi:hypothetical protein
MKDLVLSDDDRIPPDGDGHRVVDRTLADQRPTTPRHCGREAVSVICTREIGLDSMAGLERERSADWFAVQRRRESLPLNRRDVTGMGNERDDGDGRRSRHASRPSSIVGAIRRP